MLRHRGAPSIAMGVTPHLAFDETCPGLFWPDAAAAASAFSSPGRPSCPSPTSSAPR